MSEQPDRRPDPGPPPLLDYGRPGKNDGTLPFVQFLAGMFLGWGVGFVCLVAFDTAVRRPWRDPSIPYPAAEAAGSLVAAIAAVAGAVALTAWLHRRRGWTSFTAGVALAVPLAALLLGLCSLVVLPNIRIRVPPPSTAPHP